jgi:hypothetical protein
MYDLRKYLIPNYQIPDAGGAAPTDTAPPPAAADATVGSIAPALDSPASGSQPAAADPIIEQPAPPPVEPPKPPKWMLDRITETTAKKQEAERRAEAAERRAAEAEALAQRLQTNPNPPSPEGRPNINQTPLPPVDMNLVRQVANAERMAEARTDIIQKGYTEYGGAKFDETARVLQATGCVTDDFIADVLAVDRANAHKLLSKIATDGENAVRLAQLDSRTRVTELTRMTMAQASTETAPVAAPKAPATPTKVSRAPAPPPPIEPSASKTIDWRSDEASDEEFTRGFEETMKKRSARR